MTLEFTDDEVITFFKEVHGYRPFAWQRQLVRRLLSDDWPDAVDAPTGLGKTWALDAVVLAMAAAGHAGDRTAPRRVFFVVDRRTVVDEAHLHARALRDALASPTDPVVRRVKEGLLKLSGSGGTPLDVVRMRGGATWADRWVWRPDQPCIVVSTVDQVGSRLLFRGYGVSDRMRPVDAALTGTHGVVLLDEAHLALPFREVLSAVSESTRALDVPGLRTITLSATQDAGTARTLPFDVPAHESEEESHKRLHAGKVLAVLPVKPANVVASMADAARQMLGRDDVSRVLVVCNTVGTARMAFTRLRKDLGDDVGLLTGRTRSVEREWVTEAWVKRFGIAEPVSDPAILVATQTVEVGVNLDTDALVTQECALDALVQRLGRVNRIGTRVGYAVVVSSAAGKEVPVYGMAAPATTCHLTEDWHAPVLDGARAVATPDDSWLEVSPLALRDRLAVSPPDDVLIEAKHGPLLDGTVVDWWSRTSPVPDPDPPVAPYLHGLESDVGTVAVVWRADIPDVKDDKFELNVPVSAQECVEVPIGAYRQWASDDAVTDVADIEGVVLESEELVRSRRWVLRVRDATTVERVWPDRVQPGDTVLVSSLRGGLDEWGWAPDSNAPVTDVADVVPRGDRYLVRIDPHALTVLVSGDGTFSANVEAEVANLHPDANPDVGEIGGRLGEGLLTAVNEMANGQVRGAALRRLARSLCAAKHKAKLLNGDEADAEDKWVPVLSVPRLDEESEDRANLAVISDGSDTASAATGDAPVLLSVHGKAVGERAAEFAANLGFPLELVVAVRQAGAWHDMGKLHPQFQRLLTGAQGDLLPDAEPLAKSGWDTRSAIARWARRISGYPQGMRHAALSAQLVKKRLGRIADPDIDTDLVVHLVASHHGHARPFAGSVVDTGEPKPVTWTDDGVDVVAAAFAEDLSQPARFARLQRRYGPWGLALLETIVRLADMSCSREGS